MSDRRGSFTIPPRAIIGRLGGAQKTVQAAERHGIDLPLNRVRKWLDRGRISADGLADLLVLSELEGKPVSVLALAERVADRASVAEAVL